MQFALPPSSSVCCALWQPRSPLLGGFALLKSERQSRRLVKASFQGLALTCKCPPLGVPGTASETAAMPWTIPPTVPWSATAGRCVAFYAHCSTSSKLRRNAAFECRIGCQLHLDTAPQSRRAFLLQLTQPCQIHLPKEASLSALPSLHRIIGQSRFDFSMAM